MKGMAAIVSVIVLGAVMVLAGAMMLLSSINQGQMTVESQKRNNNQSLVESCVEEGLIWINENDTLPANGNIKTSFGTCPVIVNSHVGESWDITVSTNINVKLNRGGTVTIGGWQEQ
jgi:hypothetical protein